MRAIARVGGAVRRVESRPPRMEGSRTQFFCLRGSEGLNAPRRERYQARVLQHAQKSVCLTAHLDEPAEIEARIFLGMSWSRDEKNHRRHDRRPSGVQRRRSLPFL